VIDQQTLALIGVILALIWVVYEVRRVITIVQPIANSTLVRVATSV
jgi:hypothetical protein